ncbi:hypothetical protein L211DRAFT_834142 [Terfezia boudieri ATCC MYA-4762]|uniref:Uncharacterized protein n=1 Tax=Terfezia boudieri ATCC MYA-4762 TaxID=1051890 RepID=A0A3N4M2V9_9PEZI|nr:hypothetical protein L211DRAFT_834142 [Terfezia boudieri ATCC MYA-4762]
MPLIGQVSKDLYLVSVATGIEDRISKMAKIEVLIYEHPQYYCSISTLYGYWQYLH